MGKALLSSLVALFVLVLIAYNLTSSGITFILHLLLLILGLSISILMTNRVTKSKNTLKSKIYFSFILPSFIFFSIIFSTFLGTHHDIEQYGIIPSLFSMSAIIVGVISLIIGVVLSLKRKNSGDLEYDLKPTLKILSVIFILLFVLFFYNRMLLGLALSTEAKSLCHLTISPEINSLLFNAGIKERCLFLTSMKESKTGEITCGELEGRGAKNSCYSNTAKERRDVKICVDNVIPEGSSSEYYECSSAINHLKDDLYEILKDPLHPDIMYAVKSTPELGIYLSGAGSAKYARYLPLVENVAAQGNLDVRKAALDILINRAASKPFEEEKRILREEVLPIIGEDPALQEYTEMINQILSAVLLEPIPGVSVPTP